MAEFEPAFDNTIRWEDATLSGKITSDEGGSTRFGISEKANPDLFPAILEASREDALAMAEKRYEERYWDVSPFAALRDETLAEKVFDMTVNVGSGEEAKIFQRAINSCSEFGAMIAEDGRVGAATIAAANALHADELLSKIRELLREHYIAWAGTNAARLKDLKGLLRRAAS